MVWNRTPDKAHAVAANAGLKVAATPKELAAASETVDWSSKPKKL